MVYSLGSDIITPVENIREEKDPRQLRTRVFENIAVNYIEEV
jgi:hypothetical protein